MCYHWPEEGILMKSDKLHSHDVSDADNDVQFFHPQNEERVFVHFVAIEPLPLQG